MLTYDERKQLLLRRIKEDLSDDLLASEAVPLDDTASEPTPLDLYLDDLLLLAKGIIFEIQYPYVTENWIPPEDVAIQYRILQVQIATEIFAKEGAEGQTSHSEGSISRSFSSADVSTDLIDRIIPMCGVL